MATHVLTVGTGSCVSTGKPVALKAGRKILAAAGAFALTGVSVGFTEQTPVLGGTGSFAVAGQSVGLKISRKIHAVSGSFALTGNSAGINHQIPVAVSAGSFALSGQAVNLVVSRKIQIETGIYILDQQDWQEVAVKYPQSGLVPVNIAEWPCLQRA